MMKKVWLVLLAVVLVFGLAMLGCGSSGSDGPGPGPGPGGEEEELVETTVFDLKANAGIQALDVGPIPNSAFAGNGNPIKPLVRAGNDEHIAIEIVDNEGKNAIQYTTKDNWGVGLDLPYPAFGFREGDVITVSGKVITGTGKMQLNSNPGSENAIGTTYSGGPGDFTLTVTLTAANVNQISKANPPALRIEARASGQVVQINSITIVGQRPADIKPLETPVVELLEDEDLDDDFGPVGITWAGIEGAGGFEVYYAAWAETIADADYALLASVGGSVTELVLFGKTELTEGSSYSVYIIAKGIEGASADSAKSNAVKYTKKTPANPEITIKVDGSNKLAELFSVNGKTLELEDGNGYTFARAGGYDSSYNFFSVNFGASDKLSNYGKITFKYQGVQGDIGYKRIFIVASATPFSGNFPRNNPLNASEWTGSAFVSGPQMNGIAEVSVSLIIPKNKADTYTGSTVYFGIYIDAAATGDKDPETGNAVDGSSWPTIIKVSDIAFIKDGGAKDGATLDSIKVKTAPTKEEYAASETFAPAGLVITANNLFGTTPNTGYAEDIAYNATDFTFKSGSTAITAATVMQTAFPDQKVTVTVVYKTKETTFDVKVGTVAPDLFESTEGIKDGSILGMQGNATFDATTGIIDLSDTSGSKLFTIKLPSATAAAGSKIIKVEYICKLVSGEPKLTWKTTSWGDPPNKGSENIYPTLTVGSVATLSLPETIYADATETIAFQVNNDSNAFKLKIISIKVE
jgi:hypothetical protein